MVNHWSEPHPPESDIQNSIWTVNNSAAAHLFENGDTIKKELFDICAGITLPCRGQQVYYFPQGYIEQFMNKEIELPFELPSKILCEVSNAYYKAIQKTDQIVGEITLAPLTNRREVTSSPNPQPLAAERPAVHSYSIRLTRSNVQPHGTLSIKKDFAEKCLPPLSQEEAHQYLFATDLQGKEWRFKHVFRGKPNKRHLLTEGWKDFAKSKKLEKGDELIFLRGETGQLLIGLKKLKDTDDKFSVISLENKCVGALTRAHMAIDRGTSFSFNYKPRANRCEFMVNVNKYLEAQNHNLSIGTRFSMRFEVGKVHKSFIGTIAGFDDNESSRWVSSQWRSIKVNWDKASPFLPRRVSPWELEPTSNSQIILSSKRALHTVGFAQHISCQRRRIEGELNKSCSCINKVESSYDDDTSGANKEGDIEVSTERNESGNIECPDSELDKLHSNFCWEQNSPGLSPTEFGNLSPDLREFRNSPPLVFRSNECTTLPLTEFEISLQPPQVASTSQGSLIRTFQESCGPAERNRFGNIECPHEFDMDNFCWAQNSPSLPLVDRTRPPTEISCQQPQLARTSQGHMIGTSYNMDCKVDFHSFRISNHVIPYLESIYSKIGNFWRESEVESASIMEATLEELGKALYLMMKDGNLVSLNTEELKTIKSKIKDATVVGFKLDGLQSIVRKAEAVLRAKDQCHSLEEQKSCLESQLRGVESEHQNAEGELKNCQQELGSLVSDIFPSFI
ncbi:auxin response factor 12 isoform X2 [Hevea brasiliensis]|uniref:auxin response factor 12 isoform X2 n=1 Tax=Hevea brasiliensis TaxID=3981 RepID=UPI0025E505FA|nr:auxin response factor 12 isoform X2 [Hevea brasiliensis]